MNWWVQKTNIKKWKNPLVAHHLASGVSCKVISHKVTSCKVCEVSFDSCYENVLSVGWISLSVLYLKWLYTIWLYMRWKMQGDEPIREIFHFLILNTINRCASTFVPHLLLHCLGTNTSPCIWESTHTRWHCVKYAKCLSPHQYTEWVWTHTKCAKWVSTHAKKIHEVSFNLC